MAKEVHLPRILLSNLRNTVATRCFPSNMFSERIASTNTMSLNVLSSLLDARGSMCRISLLTYVHKRCRLRCANANHRWIDTRSRSTKYEFYSNKVTTQTMIFFCCIFFRFFFLSVMLLSPLLFILHKYIFMYPFVHANTHAVPFFIHNIPTILLLQCSIRFMFIVSTTGHINGESSLHRLCSNSDAVC